jgi:hypothetical protein
MLIQVAQLRQLSNVLNQKAPQLINLYIMHRAHHKSPAQQLLVCRIPHIYFHRVFIIINKTHHKLLVIVTLTKSQLNYMRNRSHLWNRLGPPQHKLGLKMV